PRLVIAFVVDRDAHGNAGIVDDDIEATEMRGHFADHVGDVVAVGDVERPGFRRTSCCHDLVGDDARGICTDVGDGDLGAVGRVHTRGSAAHAAGGAGDEDGQAFDRAAELLEI